MEKWNSEFLRILKDNHGDSILELMTVENYNRNMVLYNKDSEVKGIYIVLDGIVKQVVYKHNRKPIIQNFVKKGEVIGFRSLITNESTCTTSIVLKKAKLGFIPAHLILSILKENSELSYNLTKFACRELKLSNNHLVEVSQLTVKNRLANTLIYFKDEFGLDEQGYLDIEMTRGDLAGFIGTATASLIRLLSDFEKREYVQLNRRKIRILNFQALQHLCIAGRVKSFY